MHLDHRPEAADQNIMDGLWHEVGFSIDRGSSVAHLFHDGRRVAVHNLSGLGSRCVTAVGDCLILQRKGQETYGSGARIGPAFRFGGVTVELRPGLSV